MILESNTNSSIVPFPIMIQLTSTPLTTVAEPGIVLAGDFVLRGDRTGGDGIVYERDKGWRTQ